jgi:hypothetical protein
LREQAKDLKVKKQSSKSKVQKGDVKEMNCRLKVSAEIPDTFVSQIILLSLSAK